jgi:hypothetical protein
MNNNGKPINPYIAGNPVTGREMFFGREEVFEFIQQALKGRHQDNAIVLYGQRRTGKTSVLYQLHRHLDPQYIPVLIDLQAFSMQGMATFLWEISGTICRTLRREHSIEVKQPDRQDFALDPRQFFHDSFLGRVWSAVGERRLVLMFDEAIRLEDEVVAGGLERDVFDYMRHLMQHNQRLRFIFSLGSRLEEMGQEYAKLFNVALYKQITHLSSDAAQALITLPVKGAFEYDDAAVDYILEVGGRHAYYTQLICHSIFARWERTGSRQITVADVQAILPEVVERGTANLKFLWDQASPLDQLVMAAMAQLMDGKNTPVAASEIYRKLRGQQISVSTREMEKALGDLVSKEAITRLGGYRFTTALLLLYLERHYKMEWVREALNEAAKQARKAEGRSLSAARRPRLVKALSFVTAIVVLGVLIGGLAGPYLRRVVTGSPPASAPSANSPSVPPAPGLYTFERCGLPPVGKDERVRLKLCVDSVEVSQGGAMQFNISWKAEVEQGLVLDGIRVTGLVKYSDVGNTKMYVTDDRGNRYDFTVLGAAARDETFIPNGGTAKGWFLFPPPKGDARLFTFHDDDNFWAIPGILLEQS